MLFGVSVSGRRARENHILQGERVNIVVCDTLVPVSRVLVVDDEPEVRQVVRRALERLGHRVTEASDGQEAIKALDGGGFDLFHDCSLFAFTASDFFAVTN